MKKRTIVISFILLFMCCTSLFGEVHAAFFTAAPVLKETSCVSTKGKPCCVVTFESVPGAAYRVYRREAGSKSYKALGRVAAEAQATSYHDRTCQKNKIYYYTVRRYLSEKTLSSFEKSGIKAICFDCNPKIVYTNLEAQIRFAATKEATHYVIYRKFENEAWKALKTIPSDGQEELLYRDVFQKSVTSKAQKEYIINKDYIDPTANPFRYEVRAMFLDKSGKLSRGFYAKEGTCRVCAPAISQFTVENSLACITWSRIPVAEYYNIYARGKTGAWKRLKKVYDNGESIQSTTFTFRQEWCYFTVRAFANVRGSLFGGAYESKFGIWNRTFQNKKVLFVGDSYPYGRPYNNPERLAFGYPQRVSQLLGVDTYNAAITASSFSDNRESVGIPSIFTDVIEPLAKGEQPLGIGENTTKAILPLWEYDYIVLEGGTNDYFHSMPLGNCFDRSKNSFYGALNLTKEHIENADQKRQAAGKPAIEMIVLDIPYAARCEGKGALLDSRRTTPNRLGFTAQDYSDALHFVFCENAQYPALWLKGDTVLNAQNIATESTDNLHYTKLGYGKTGYLITKLIVSGQ